MYSSLHLQIRILGVLATLVVGTSTPVAGHAAGDAGTGTVAVPTGPGVPALLALQWPETSPATLTGVVYDSTRARVLSGARVAVVGTSVTALTDSGGAFRLKGIPPGEYSVTFHHPRLQELGVSPGVKMVKLSPGETERVSLAVPSRPTILRGWCALKEDAGGSAHVGGVVTDSLTGVPLPNARVELAPAGAAGGRESLEMRTDEQGRYRFCGVGERGWMSLQVRFGSQVSGAVAVRPEEGVAAVEDVAMTLSHEVRITGRVLDQETEVPLEGAHVQVSGTEVDGMTDGEGRFGFTGLAPGRHVLVTRNLGYEERIDTLTVFSREALGVEIHLSTDPIPLEPLVVVGRSRELETEIPWSAGTRADVMTQTEIDEVMHRVSDAADLLRLSHIPGLNVRRVTYKDDGFEAQGLCVETARARRVQRDTCAMVSVYVDGVRLSSPEYTLQSLDHQGITRIELLNGAEASALYGTRARNGVLLIFTR